MYYVWLKAQNHMRFLIEERFAIHKHSSWKQTKGDILLHDPTDCKNFSLLIVQGC